MSDPADSSRPLSGLLVLDFSQFLAGPAAAMRPARRMMRLIALFAAAPPGTVLATLRDLRFSNSDAVWVSAIVTRWYAMAAEMRFSMTSPQPPPDSVLRRWAAMAGRTQFASVMRLAAARWGAERAAGIEAPSAARVASVYRRADRIAYRDAIEVGDLALNGRDLEKAGITGPAVGQTLRTLLETVITDPASNSRDKLLESVERMRATPDGEV